MPLLSVTLERFQPSAVADIFSLAVRLEEEGRDIVRLNSGEPDYDTEDNAKQAAIADKAPSVSIPTAPGRSPSGARTARPASRATISPSIRWSVGAWCSFPVPPSSATLTSARPKPPRPRSWKRPAAVSAGLVGS